MPKKYRATMRKSPMRKSPKVIGRKTIKQRNSKTIRKSKKSKKIYSNKKHYLGRGGWKKVNGNWVKDMPPAMEKVDVGDMPPAIEEVGVEVGEEKGDMQPRKEEEEEEDEEEEDEAIRDLIIEIKRKKKEINMSNDIRYLNEMLDTQNRIVAREGKELLNRTSDLDDDDAIHDTYLSEDEYKEERNIIESLNRQLDLRYKFIKSLEDRIESLKKTL